MYEVERRRVRREEDEPEAARVPEPALLTLQRSAGNRAVSRLVYNEATRTVTGTSAYGSQRVPWNKETKRRRTGKAATVDEKKDPTLFDLAKDAAVLERIRDGLSVPEVKKLLIDTPQALTQIGERNAGLASMREQLGEAAGADNAVVHHVEGDPITTANQRQRVRKVLLPIDYLPEPDDLPGANEDLRDKTIRANGKRSWQLVCTLIALYKADGIGKVQEVLEDNTIEDNIDAVVTAMHRAFLAEGIQYDDTSSRYLVMKKFGYRMIFSGRSSWAELHNHVMLNGERTYIFDIEGHTVKVRMKRDYGPYIPEPPKLTDVFEPDSDDDNYSRGAEFLKNVHYIWTR